MRKPVLPATFDPTTWTGRILDTLDRAVLGALLAAVTAMVAIVAAQVVMRYAFNQSFDWADELSRLAFIWSIFLAIPLGVRQGAHIGIDIVINRFPARTQRVLRRGGALLCAAMTGVIAWAALGVALEQWDELMSVLDWSVGWFIVPVVIGMALSALHLLRIAITGPLQAHAGSAE